MSGLSVKMPKVLVAAYSALLARPLDLATFKREEHLVGSPIPPALWDEVETTSWAAEHKLWWRDGVLTAPFMRHPTNPHRRLHYSY